jgi:hypothetical protein
MLENLKPTIVLLDPLHYHHPNMIVKITKYLIHYAKTKNTPSFSEEFDFKHVHVSRHSEQVPNILTQSKMTGP